VLDENAVAKAHAVYTPFTLAIYDVLVHGFSNRFAWRCPTRRLVELYRENLAPIIWRRGWARVCFSIALRRQS
jgi:hypothetical protein